MDDHTTQRPYRSSDGGGHTAPGRSAANAGNDPLAELARLIGQTDPFAEYSRKQPAPQQIAQPAAQGAPFVRQQAGAPDYGAAPMPLPEPPSFMRQPSYGGAPLAVDPDAYQGEGDQHGHHQGFDQGYAPRGQNFGYDDHGYPPGEQQHPGEHDDYYDDVPSSRRRMSVMVIAGVFALAVLGTAGAFGYRAIFGGTGSSTPPPVIKADTAPSKVVPPSNRDASTKPISDRVADRGQIENLVSREEQPIDIKDRSATAAMPPLTDQIGGQLPAQGSGVVTPDAKRVRTISIKPDQASLGDSAGSMPPAQPPAAAPPPPAPPRVATVVQPARPAAPPPRVAPTALAAEPEPDAAPPPAARKPVTPRVPPAVAQHQASANAPLSLSPDAQASAPAPGPARVAPRAVAPPPTPMATASAGSAGGGYAVQVSSQRSEAEAQAAFRALQGQFPGQLGNRQPMIHRVDLGDKGIYYRAMVGPFANGNDASQLCASLKAAGGSCLIQRN